MSRVSANRNEQIVFTTCAIALTSCLIVLGQRRVRRILLSNVSRWKIQRLCEKRAEAQESEAEQPRVSGVFVYPVKSLRAVSVPTATLDPLGLSDDRRLMIVRPCPPPLCGAFGTNEPTHRFVSQRQCPSLATVVATLPSCGDEGTKREENKISLSSHSVPNKTVSIDVSKKALETYPNRYRAGVWDDVVEVVDVGDDAANYIRQVVTLDSDTFSDVRVVSILPVTVRECDERYAPPAALTSSGSMPKVALSDGFPILIACEASLEELNRRLVAKGKESIPMSRFRPNIVIKNTKPFEEDTWKAVLIGNDTVLHVVKGCPRCKQSCTDQTTGEQFDEPLTTLADFRALGRTKEDVYFAQNAVLQPGGGSRVRVGDCVTVLTRGDPVWDIGAVQAE